jgi:RNA polymerase sigma factor (sigma-70 family)
MDRRRLADVRAGSVTQVQASGSGYLVGPHLILTARHIVVDGSGSPRERIEAWIGHPADSPVIQRAVRVQWDDSDSDLALLRFESEIGLPDAAIRWGCFIGSSPVRYEGLAFPAFSRYESGSGLEQLGGYLPPLAVGDRSCYVLDQGAAPTPDGTAQWGGASGAPVFCGDLLVATVARDDRAFGNKRLHATRLVNTLANADFASLIAADTGAWPVAEAVELREFLKSPRRRRVAKTPGSLLAAELEAVTFTGRQEVLDELSSWRDGEAQLGLTLVVGEGGQGKTRLAQEFARLSARRGWIAGFLETSLTHTGQLGGAPDVRLIGLMRASNRPILIVADYAEAHPEYIENILEGIREEVTQSPVRLLLLSRTVNVWWENISEILPVRDVRLIPLSPLSGEPAVRRALYATGVAGLASHLPMLDIESSGDWSATDWPSIAARLADSPPDLSDDRLGNALTLLMAALTDLLAVGSGRAPLRAGNFAERELVAHELGYLRRTATKHGLLGAGVLSSRTDPHERSREAWGILEKAIAGLILLGPTDADRAHTIGMLASPHRAADIIAWLAALYPAAGEYRIIGAMQPDRLAELVLGQLLAKRHTLAGEIARRVKNFDGAVTLLFTMLRTGAYPQFASVRDQARDIIVRQPVPYAEAALVLAVNLAHIASVQGNALATPALQAILRNVYFRSDPVDPEEFSSAIRTALGRLALPNSSVAPAATPAQPPAGPTDPGSRLDERGSLYRELSRGGPLFVQALLDVAVDVLEVGFDEVRTGAESEQTPPLSQPSPGYLQLVAEVYSSHYDQLIRLASVLAHDREAAEEIVQDSFAEVLGSSRDMRETEEILLNTRRAVIDKAAPRWQKRSSFTEAMTLLRERGIPGIEDEVLDRSAVVDAIRLLPQRQAEVLVLRYYADLSEADISRVMGISRGAVKSHMARALVSLRHMLGNES